jgi:quinolinate synthase
MKRNTLEKLYLCMEYEVPRYHDGGRIKISSKKPIERMLEISKKAGL